MSTGYLYRPGAFIPKHERERLRRERREAKAERKAMRRAAKRDSAANTAPRGRDTIGELHNV